MTLEIRRASLEDFDLIRRLEDEIFPEDPWTDGMILEELASPYRAYFIAESLQEQGRVVCGYAGISLGLDSDVMTVGVVAEARRLGVGDVLVEAMIDIAAEAGADRVFLEVRESNVPAQKLYAKHGFEHIGRVRGYFRNPVEDAVTMRLIVLSESALA